MHEKIKNNFTNKVDSDIIDLIVNPIQNQVNFFYFIYS